MRLRSALKAFGQSRSGATSIEYAIISAGLSILIVGGAQAIGINLNNLFFVKVQDGFK